MLRLMLMSIVMLSYQLLSLTEKLASVSCCFSAKVHPVYWQGSSSKDKTESKEPAAKVACEPRQPVDVKSGDEDS